MGLSEYDDERPFLVEHAGGSLIKNLDNTQLKFILEFMQLCYEHGVTDPEQDLTKIKAEAAQVSFAADLIKLVQILGLSVALRLPVL